jgi:protein involved in polysaccharide export with SLBB domain/capsular polysaccharide biosynthesis protein
MKTDFNLGPPPEQLDAETSASETSAEARGLALVHVPRDRNGSGSEPPPVPFNVWTIAGALRQRWWWLLLASLLGAALGGAAGWIRWKTTYIASVDLVRYDSPLARELNTERQYATASFASLLRSPEILRRVSERADPAISPSTLAKRVRVIPERDSDVIAIDLMGYDGGSVVDLANLYAEEAVQFTKKMQAHAAAEATHLVTQHLARVEEEIGTLYQRFSNRADVASSIVENTAGIPVSRLQLAREELNELLERYTDIHPLVQAQRAKVAAMERSGPAQEQNGSTKNGARLTNAPATAGRTAGGAELFSGQLQSLETARLAFSERQRTFGLLQESPPGYFQVLKPATTQEMVTRRKDLKILLLGIFGGLAGLMAGGVLALGAEALDNRLKNASDVSRVTGLPVLAAAGDLYQMQDVERRHWAFGVWTNLQWHLNPSPNQSLICGFTTEDHGVSRFPWMALMSEAASQRGYRVLTIETCTAAQAAHPYKNVREVRPAAVGLISDYPADLSPILLDSKVLSSPDVISAQLTGRDQQAVLRIPLPGWVWSLHTRNQWRLALEHWSRLGNVVILVELPPVLVPETSLLAESLPNVIWETDARMSNAASARRHIQTLRHARCNVAGAVLSHASSSRLQDRFARWMAACLVGLLSVAGQCLPVSAAIELGPAVQAQPAPAQPTPAQPAPGQPAPGQPAPVGPQLPTTGGTFSALALSKRAAWQEQLTLGAGDVLSISLYGQPEFDRAEVPIAPDGSISFLEAQNVPASGLTIDQLRARMDEELSKYRRAPRTMISPVAFRSKKYFILGRIAQRGAYVLDRPMTIIEAVAHAQGIETAVIDRNTTDLADFSRSFLVRRGQRLPVDFEKLFQQGDLSQNIALEPDDYLYFPATQIREVYVLGEVKQPGPVAYRSGLGAVGAIAVRGGFTERAWRHKVLVVRGSFNKPETFPINTASVVQAREADFALQPKDVIYVSPRPWIKAEEVLDAAASSFIEAVVITWVGKKIF